MALGRSIEPGDDLEPENIFVGKIFEADVGYRSNDGRDSCDEANREAKKDERDFLRVHRLTRLVSETEAKTIMHMRSNGVIWPPKEE